MSSASARGLVQAAGLLVVLSAAVMAYLNVSSDRRVLMSLAAIALVVLSLGVGLIGHFGTGPLTVLTATFGLLLLLPENYVLVGPLKSVGNPAILAGLVCIALWAAGRVLGILVPRPGHPVRWALFAFVLASTTAWAAAFMRPLTTSESSGATRALFPLIAASGIALLCADGLRRRQDLEKLLNRVVLLGGLAALIGLLEFSSAGFKWSDVVRLPGLTTNTLVINDTRSGFTRVSAAAAHPIEFVVALTALTPLALHFCIYPLSRWLRRLSILSLALILIVTPMSVSRSGLLTLAVALVFYLVTLGWRARVNALVLGLIGIAAMRAAVPGLIGTLRSFVFAGTEDPSIVGRTQDYAQIPGLMDGHWIFGRGLGTFQPDVYFFLDNQFLGSLLEGGWLLLAGLAGVFVVGMGVARGARKRSDDPGTRSLGQALAAGIAGLAAAGATFDELSFNQTSYLLFLMVGCAAAMWSGVRNHHPAAVAPGATDDVSRPGMLVRT